MRTREFELPNGLRLSAPVRFRFVEFAMWESHGEARARFVSTGDTVDHLLADWPVRTSFRNVAVFDTVTGAMVARRSD